MPVNGAFVPKGGDRKGTKFLVEGTDLEVDSDSVSSEWTNAPSDGSPRSETPPTSEPPALGFDGAAAKPAAKKKRKVRRWRLAHRVPRAEGGEGGGGSSSSTTSGSGCSSEDSSTSSGSSSTSEGEVARQKRQRCQLMADWDVACAKPGAGGAQQPEADGRPPPLRQGASLQAIAARPEVARMPLEWFNAEKRYRSYAVAPAFLSPDDIEALHLAARHKSVAQINDRKGYLAFKHRVWRFELQLRALYPRLYGRLLELMRRADAEKWRRMRQKSKKVYPEVEYIEYDVAIQGQPCFIEPHVDNKSAVTMVAMLSKPGDYEGGASCFRRADGRRGHREHALQQGDIVLFRGEKLTHWITPVTGGRRMILQIELSRV